MRILIVDNFDSFTNNVADFLRGLRNDIVVDIIRNDDFDFLNAPAFQTYDAIIISPGPGNPTNSKDLGISLDILKSDTRPILGICLGHQAMAAVAGGHTHLASEPMHGRQSEIHHAGLGLYAGLPSPLKVMRYHSWVVDPDLPDNYVADSWTDDGTVMGVHALDAPRWGVQFHPESIASECGRVILSNFLELVDTYQDQPGVNTSDQDKKKREIKILHWQSVGPALDPTHLVEAQELINNRRPLLLESSLVREGLSRFSIVEVPDDSDRSITYNVQSGMLTTRDGQDLATCDQKSIFDALDDAQCDVIFPDGPPPFNFHGGLVGWLGYELKAELLDVSSDKSKTADAAFRFVNRYFVVDHKNDVTYAAVCISPSDAGLSLEVCITKMQRIFGDASLSGGQPENIKLPDTQSILDFKMRHDPDAYLDLIKACQHEIQLGESYELCLTNTITAKIDLDSWGVYKLLRKRNPAPYSAFLNIDDTEVVACSPERFLTVDGQGIAQSKPIKGTAKRSQNLAKDKALANALEQSEKERAENVMIVDLVRHDFASFSIPGSIDVTKLCDIESFKTVHQLVSTVQGRLRPGLNCVDAIRATFPGGSMTGAPKKRSVEILKELENGPRGIYSGAMGWIGYDGQTDLSIVIRTVVKQGREVTVGCGGAITHLSNPDDELAEIMLKSRSLLGTLSEYATGSAENYNFSQPHNSLSSRKHETLVSEGDIHD